MKKWVLSCLIVCSMSSMSIFAANSWKVFLSQVRHDAIEQGVRAGVVDSAFSKLRAPSKRVLKYDRTQPEKRITFQQYRSTRGDRYRIVIGRRKYKRYKKLVDSIAQHYGVSPCFMMSLWGLETSYGHYKGRFSVIQSLATLAYDSRRSNFFRKELILALHILNQGHIDLPNFKGEWAGGSGHPQFIPSSWHHYAVDYNGDGQKDIWNNMPDAFASIANYLKKNGWKKNGRWAIEVVLPRHFDSHLLSRKVVKPAWKWKALGVKGISRQVPDTNINASVIYPDGGPALMVFNNFNVIMRWNRSIYYAGTVGYIAERICRRHL